MLIDDFNDKCLTFKEIMEFLKKVWTIEDKKKLQSDAHESEDEAETLT